MAHIGYGYGSEWHLLYHLGRRRAAFSRRVEAAVGGQEMVWLDDEEYVDRESGALCSREQRGLEFLGPSNGARQSWEQVWPQSGNVHNWDAVGRCASAAGQRWVLVEAKAHVGEMKSSCGAVSAASRQSIRSVLDRTRDELGAPPDRDWTQDHYQFCNRLALLHFLGTHHIDAHLVYVYFTGDRAELGVGARMCPTSEAGWRDALQREEDHVGLPAASPIRKRVHRLFVPAYRARIAETASSPSSVGNRPSELVRPVDADGPGPARLADEFHDAMMQIYLRAKTEAGYNATRFFQMLQEHGGVETARRLLPHMSDGFGELWRRSRLDLTVEALVLDLRWSSIFSDAERQVARDRLRESGAEV